MKQNIKEQVEILKNILNKLAINFITEKEDLADFRENFVQLKKILSQYEDEPLVKISFDSIGDIIVESYEFIEDEKYEGTILFIRFSETERLYQIEVSYGKKTFNIEIKRY